MGGRREKADELVASSRHETIIGLGDGKKGSDSQPGSEAFRICSTIVSFRILMYPFGHARAKNTRTREFLSPLYELHSILSVEVLLVLRKLIRRNYLVKFA